MKNRSSFACLVLILAVLLAGCAGEATTPPADTVVAPSATIAPPQPSATQPPPTALAPTQTPLPPAPTQPPADTPLPTAAPATPVSSPVPTLPDLQLEGLWHGGGDDFLVDFFISGGADSALVSDVGILWHGQGECELNARYDVQLPLDENGFSMTYNKDDIYFFFSATEISPGLILGVFNLRYKGCGEHKINWRAVPKTGMSQRP